MDEITVRALTEDEWDDFRSVRLAALQESPEAFVASYEDEKDYDEDFWRLRLRRSKRLIAERDGEAVGIVSVGQDPNLDGEDATHSELFGLWVTPSLRGKGVASKLVRAGAQDASDGGSTHLNYWVGTDNGRAVAFASSFGFRPTDRRRPIRIESEADGDEEAMMVLPLSH